MTYDEEVLKYVSMRIAVLERVIKNETERGCDQVIININQQKLDYFKAIKERLERLYKLQWTKDYKLLELIKHKRVETGTLMLTNEYTEYNDIMAARNLPTLTNIQYKRIKKYMGGTHG